LISFGHIRFEKAGLLGRAAPPLKMTFRLLFIPSDQNDPRAGLQKSPCHFTAQYACTTNYDCDPAFKVKKLFIKFAWILLRQFNLLISFKNPL
jgi:hypothetical protein